LNYRKSTPKVCVYMYKFRTLRWYSYYVHVFTIFFLNLLCNPFELAIIFPPCPPYLPRV
jgi:hypothetical protein